MDPKTSRWLSGDSALGDYVPSAPVDDEARKRNGNLPGQGGVFNYVNLHVYHYAGNNPVKYVDPDEREVDIIFLITSYEKTSEGIRAFGSLQVTDRETGESVTVNAYSGGKGQADDGVSLPIPLGDYEVLEPTKVGYRLEAKDKNQGNDKVDSTKPLQENLRLHKPGRGLSYGCIGVATNDEWEKVINIINSTSVGSSKVQLFKGLKELEIRKYGDISVKQSPHLANNFIYPSHPSVKSK